MNVQIDIERLILDGFDLTFRERQQLRASLESELGRLIAANGLTADLLTRSVVPNLQTDGFAYTPGQDASETGRQIARAVYQSIVAGAVSPGHHDVPALTKKEAGA